MLQDLSCVSGQVVEMLGPREPILCFKRRYWLELTTGCIRIMPESLIGCSRSPTAGSGSGFGAGLSTGAYPNQANPRKRLLARAINPKSSSYMCNANGQPTHNILIIEEWHR